MSIVFVLKWVPEWSLLPKKYQDGLRFSCKISYRGFMRRIAKRFCPLVLRCHSPRNIKVFTTSQSECDTLYFWITWLPCIVSWFSEWLCLLSSLRFCKFCQFLCAVCTVSTITIQWLDKPKNRSKNAVVSLAGNTQCQCIGNVGFLISFSASSHSLHTFFFFRKHLLWRSRLFGRNK